MGKILVFQHVAWEILGTLHALIKDQGHRIRYVNFSRDPERVPNLDGYDALIVLGGPMNVDQEKQFPHLTTELKLLEDAFKRNLPILGICLGAQLIAKSLGADVRTNPMPEIGWHELTLTEQGRQHPVFSDFAHQEKIFQWHGDTFQIPQSAIHLAKSKLCENQAFLYLDRVLGLQFHLEVDRAMLHRWLEVPAMYQEFVALNGAVNIAEYLDQSEFMIQRQNYLAKNLFGNWIAKLPQSEKKKILPSR